MVGIGARSLRMTFLISALLLVGVWRQRSQPNHRHCLRRRAASCFLHAIAPSVTGAMLLAANPVPI